MHSLDSSLTHHTLFFWFVFSFWCAQGSSAALEKMYPGVGPWPMAGLGIATTDDFDTAIFKQVNWTADDASLLGYVCTDPPPPLPPRT
jgi:hypothetical protein